jgi:hypothetical protein
VQTIKPLVMQSSTRPCYLSGPNILLSTVFSNTLSPQRASKHVCRLKSIFFNGANRTSACLTDFEIQIFNFEYLSSGHPVCAQTHTHTHL